MRQNEHISSSGALKVATVVGARPQFIKAAAVSRVIRCRSDIVEVIIHTGQHYANNMSDIFFGELDIPTPDYNLSIGSLSHGAQTGRMLEAIETVFATLKPDWVLVYGDTNSTLAGALAASKLHIPVAHVEAGLRSFNKRMPEEINRILVDHVSNLLFAPTPTALQHLQREGIDHSLVRLVGDVMYDAAMYYGESAERRSDVLSRLGLANERYYLATIHRAENTDDIRRLRNIVEALVTVAKTRRVVLPIHPRTRESLRNANLFTRLATHITIIEPVGYLDMIMLEKRSSLILTDSGGVQKEAYFFGIPCVTLRQETEWTELIEAGVNKLAPPESKEKIVRAVEAFRQTSFESRPRDLYGTGQTATDIANELIKS